ncbi:PIN domain-containing protein [Streptomyces sp. NBC_00342]|uniref:PIN domain-containing protein n=1 Tax=Streptomyces sp. NBC_00342 TaxID=2975718 RepID=UPI002E2B3D17|nr:PIN domain-containing protein [Streptomyces sp. NBC_00342]
MIILDTCILEKVPFDSTSADLLKTIQTSGVDVVAVPDTVMIELTSHRVVPQREKHEKAVQAVENFAKSLPWPATSPKPALDLDRLALHWQKRWEEMVTVIPTSPAALREGIRRESMALPPCRRVEASGGTHKIGGRDAAIWLTAVEYARENPSEPVVFVSANTSDFGDGTSYPYPMDGDVDKLSNFVHLTTFTELISRFATRSNVDEAVALKALTSPESEKAVLRAVRMTLGISRHRPVLPFEVSVCRKSITNHEDIAANDLETFMAHGFRRPPKIRLDSVRDMTAHRIGDHVWCSVTARWFLAGLISGERDGGRETFWSSVVLPAGTTWETRVLFSPTQPGTPLTVLRTWSPQCATPAEFANMPELPSVAEAERVWRTQLDRRGESAAHTSRFVQELLVDVGEVPLSELRGGGLPYTGALARKSAIDRRLRNMMMEHTAPDLDEDED